MEQEGESGAAAAAAPSATAAEAAIPSGSSQSDGAQAPLGAEPEQRAQRGRPEDEARWPSRLKEEQEEEEAAEEARERLGTAPASQRAALVQAEHSSATGSGWRSAGERAALQLASEAGSESGLAPGDWRAPLAAFERPSFTSRPAKITTASGWRQTGSAQAATPRAEADWPDVASARAKSNLGRDDLIETAAASAARPLGDDSKMPAARAKLASVSELRRQTGGPAPLGFSLGETNGRPGSSATSTLAPLAATSEPPEYSIGRRLAAAISSNSALARDLSEHYKQPVHVRASLSRSL